MTTKHWFLDDEPDAKFRVYCRGNVGEVVPHVATPLSATITTAAFRRAFTDMFGGTGAFSAADVAGPSAVGGVFGGYLYFNLSFARSFAARAPGMRVADVDQQMFGTGGGAPPYRAVAGDRSPATKLRAGIGLVRSIVGRRAPDLDAERAETEEWLASLPADPTDDEVTTLAARYHEQAAGHLRSLLEAGFGLAIPVSILERLTRRAERAAPGLLVKAMSGLGTIETAQPAVALWQLGRVVAASTSLTSAFDQGVEGLLSRLRSNEAPDVADFVAGFDAFLAAHGHRGPNEVEFASETWTTAPDTALAVVERLRFTDASANPVAASRRLAVERDEARRRLREQVLPPLRPVVARLLETGSRGSARREQSKGTLVLALSGVRRALFGLADRLVAEGQLPDRLQFFMATVDELPELLRDPASFSDELARRRARYDELNALVPPFAFEGEISDPDTWPRRSDRAPDAQLDTFTGIGVAAGKARGKARIIIDPSDPRGIEPGEVLVAPLTDPAWTPLFLAATAVVVDVGALQSHAAIVARELGIPAVVSVEGASAQLADGDEVEVDGDRGIVKVLNRSPRR